LCLNIIFWSKVAKGAKSLIEYLLSFNIVKKISLNQNYRKKHKSAHLKMLYQMCGYTYLQNFQDFQNYFCAIFPFQLSPSQCQNLFFWQLGYTSHTRGAKPVRKHRLGGSQNAFVYAFLFSISQGIHMVAVTLHIKIVKHKLLFVKIRNFCNFKNATKHNIIEAWGWYGILALDVKHCPPVSLGFAKLGGVYDFDILYRFFENPFEECVEQEQKQVFALLVSKGFFEGEIQSERSELRVLEFFGHGKPLYEKDPYNKIAPFGENVENNYLNQNFQNHFCIRFPFQPKIMEVTV